MGCFVAIVIMVAPLAIALPSLSLLHGQGGGVPDNGEEEEDKDQDDNDNNCMLWEHEDDDNSSGGGARTTTMRRRTPTMMDKDGAIVRETHLFPDNDNNDDDTDKVAYIKESSGAGLPSALAAWHRCGERERMRRF